MALRKFSAESLVMQLCWKVLRRFILPGHLLLGRISLTSCDLSSLMSLLPPSPLWTTKLTLLNGKPFVGRWGTEGEVEASLRR